MSNLADLIGVSCEPLHDDGTLAVADIAIEFADEDPVFVYVEKVGQKIRFSDEGNIVSHMLARGVDLDDRSDTTFITCLTEPEGVTLNDAGDLEIWADPVDAHAAFLRFVAAMLAVVAWESTTRACVRMIGQRPKVVLEPG
jgi:3-deoxy-D-arabino-heptulosonate 7-phosphate (DAHP) synthase